MEQLKEAFKTMNRAANMMRLEGKKAKYRIGGLKKALKDDLTDKCVGCGRDVYLTDRHEEIKEMLAKDCKIICPFCALNDKRYNKEVTPQLKKLLEKIIDQYTTKIAG